MGYFDLLRDLIEIAMYVCKQICLALASGVSPDLREARLVQGSVRALPASEPCTT